VRRLWDIPPNQLDFDLTTIRASIKYLDKPAILPDKPLSFIIKVENVRLKPISGSVTIQLPDGWVLEPPDEQRISLKPREKIELKFTVRASIRYIDVSNRGTVTIMVDERPDLMRLPLNFVGGFRWLISKVFRDPLSLDAEFPPERDADLMELGVGWRAISLPENSLEVEPFFGGRSGIIYLRHFIYSPNERRVILGVPNNSRMRLWLNGEFIHETKRVVPLRPNYGGDGSNYAEAILKSGWNHIMIKLLRADKPLEAHFVIADAEWKNGMIDLIRCRFPWE